MEIYIFHASPEGSVSFGINLPQTGDIQLQ